MSFLDPTALLNLGSKLYNPFPTAVLQPLCFQKQLHLHADEAPVGEVLPSRYFCYSPSVCSTGGFSTVNYFEILFFFMMSVGVFCTLCVCESHVVWDTHRGPKRALHSWGWSQVVSCWGLDLDPQEEQRVPLLLRRLNYCCSHTSLNNILPLKFLLLSKLVHFFKFNSIPILYTDRKTTYHMSIQPHTSPGFLQNSYCSLKPLGLGPQCLYIFFTTFLCLKLPSKWLINFCSITQSLL